jgi:hypothetical protein
MDEQKETRRRHLEPRNNRSQHITVGMGSTSSKVVMMMRHWGSGCEKVKSEFDGDCLVLAVPS